MRPLILSFLFFTSLELLLIKPFWLLWIFFGILIITVLGLVQAKRKLFSLAPTGGGLPLIFLGGNFLFFSLLAGRAWQHIYIVLATLVFYLIFRSDLDRVRTSSFVIFLTAFLWQAGIYGVYLNLFLPLWLVILAVLLITLGLNYQLLAPFRTAPSFWLYIFVLGLIVAESTWVLSFWPFGYLTIGATLFIIYYVISNIIKHSLKGTFNKSIVWISL